MSSTKITIVAATGPGMGHTVRSTALHAYLVGQGVECELVHADPDGYHALPLSDHVVLDCQPGSAIADYTTGRCSPVWLDGPLPYVVDGGGVPWHPMPVWGPTAIVRDTILVNPPTATPTYIVGVCLGGLSGFEGMVRDAVAWVRDTRPGTTISSPYPDVGADKVMRWEDCLQHSKTVIVSGGTTLWEGLYKRGARQVFVVPKTEAERADAAAAGWHGAIGRVAAYTGKGTPDTWHDGKGKQRLTAQILAHFGLQMPSK